MHHVQIKQNLVPKMFKISTLSLWWMPVSRTQKLQAGGPVTLPTDGKHWTKSSPANSWQADPRASRHSSRGKWAGKLRIPVHTG